MSQVRVRTELGRLPETLELVRRGPCGKIKPELESSIDFHNYYFGHSGKVVE
jgi:hypothetical protein